MPSLRRLTTGSKDIFKLVLHSLDWYCHSGSSSIVQQHEAGCVRWLLICLLGFPGGFYSLIQVSLQQCKQKCSVNVSFTWISLPQPPMPGRWWGNNSNTNNSNLIHIALKKKNKERNIPKVIFSFSIWMTLMQVLLRSCYKMEFGNGREESQSH